MDLVAPQAIIDGARALVGARWRHCGRKPWAVDCIGLVLLACESAGFNLPDTIGVALPKTYSLEPYSEMGGLLERHFERITAPMPACMIVISFPGRPAAHFALYTERQTIIHAHNLHGVVEHGYRHPWTKMVHSIWRLPGVNYGAVA